MTDFQALLRTLAENRVEFILVGGVAAAVHGATRLTADVDVVYHRTRENVERLVQPSLLTVPTSEVLPPDCRFDGAPPPFSAV